MFEQHYEVHWASMWMRMANDELAPRLNIDPIPYVNFNSVRSLVLFRGDTYKMPAIIEHVGNRPFAWVDDHIGDDAFQWAAHREIDKNIPTKLFRTAPEDGMEPFIEDIIEWGQSISPDLSAAATAPASDLTPSLE
jgi:hypothetical protein